MPLPTVEKCRPPKPWVKAKSSLSGRNYFITMHQQAGVNFENFTEVKFRDILLTGTGHRDRCLNRDNPGQTYGRSNLNQNLKRKSSFRFIREKPFAIPSFDQKCRPHEKCRHGALPPLVRSLLLGLSHCWYILIPCQAFRVHVAGDLNKKYHRSWWWTFPEIFQTVGGQRRSFSYPFKVADDTMKMDVHKTLYPFYFFSLCWLNPNSHLLSEIFSTLRLSEMFFLFFYS